MQLREHAVANVEELHAFVHQTLCERENLLAEQFTTQQIPLHSKERVCGIEFSLYGLRNIRLGAIWAADPNVIYFYDAKGERYLKVQLTERFSFQKQAA